MARDNQRSRVYAWERAVIGSDFYTPDFETLDQCEEFLHPIWRAERGRYGHAKAKPPVISRNLWGQRSATASLWGHELKLPRWSRSRWVILHETAHLLIRGNRRGGDHGPRFVGVLIGLAARHLGHDAQRLVDLACEHGVDVDIRSIGAVPELREPTMADQLLEVLPGRVTQLAWRIGARRAQIRGAVLTLIRQGRARYYRGRIVAVTA